MEDEKELDEILSRIYKSRPVRYSDIVGMNRDAVRATHAFLSESGGEVSAGDISRELKVSTARTAKIIKTMIEKDLIVKRVDENDARKVKISLSEHGREIVDEHMKEMKKVMKEVIGRIGLDKIKSFLNTAEEIKETIDEMMQEGYFDCSHHKDKVL